MAVGESECRNATHGRTTTSVFAMLKGIWQMCSIRKGDGIFLSSTASPISSKASRRAISNGDSVMLSAFPPGNAAWPEWLLEYIQTVLQRSLSLGKVLGTGEIA